MNALNIPEYMQTLGLQARQASARMASASAAEKSEALRTLAGLLRAGVQQLQADSLAGISASERAQLTGLLQRVHARLQRDREDG